MKKETTWLILFLAILALIAVGLRFILRKDPVVAEPNTPSGSVQQKTDPAKTQPVEDEVPFPTTPYVAEHAGEYVFSVSSQRPYYRIWVQNTGSAPLKFSLHRKDASGESLRDVTIEPGFQGIFSGLGFREGEDEKIAIAMQGEGLKADFSVRTSQKELPLGVQVGPGTDRHAAIFPIGQAAPSQQKAAQQDPNTIRKTLATGAARAEEIMHLTTDLPFYRVWVKNTSGGRLIAEIRAATADGQILRTLTMNAGEEGFLMGNLEESGTDRPVLVLMSETGKTVGAEIAIRYAAETLDETFRKAYILGQ